MLMKRFGGDKAQGEQFIAEYVKRHGPEPPSKEIALREYFTKTYHGDTDSIESAMKLIKDVPGIEVQIFTELMIEEERKKKAAASSTANAKAPAGAPAKTTATAAPNNNTTAAPAAKTAAGTKQAIGSPSVSNPSTKFPQPAANTNNNNNNNNQVTSPSQQQQHQTKLAAGGSSSTVNTPNASAGANVARPAPLQQKSIETIAVVDNSSNNPIQKQSSPSNGNSSNNRNANYNTSASHQEVEIQTVARPKSTCDKLVRDRVVAMLATYDPDSLLLFDEDSDIPTTEVGSSFLQALTEQHGPEPVSKRSAIETLLRRLLQKQDPARLKSIGTLMAAAESTGREVQIVRSLFTAYGVESRPGKSVASSGLASVSTLINNNGNFNNNFYSSSGFGGGSSSSPVAALSSTASIMASFHAGGVGLGNGWSPDASISAQKSIFDSSPRRMPLRTKEDLLYQLSGSPKVHKSHPNARGSDFSDLLTLDTEHGPEPLFGDDDKRREQFFGNGGGTAITTKHAMDFQLSDLEPFRKTAAGVTHTVADNEEDDLPMPSNHINPFMRPGAAQQQNSRVATSPKRLPDFPKTPPSSDLGNFGRL